MARDLHIPSRGQCAIALSDAGLDAADGIEAFGMELLRVSTGVAAVRASDAGERVAPDQRSQTQSAPQPPAELSAAQAETVAASARSLVAQITGANTRVQVDRREGAPGFTYRAIDIATGEVVAEWPFGGDSDDPFAEPVRGVVLDRQA
jgi:hypothetical protein